MLVSSNQQACSHNLMFGGGGHMHIIDRGKKKKGQKSSTDPGNLVGARARF